jgi:hypothetical protein
MAEPSAQGLAVLHGPAAELIEEIVQPVIDRGGTVSEIMELTEDMLVGVCLLVLPMGADKNILEIMLANARHRLADIRLIEVDPAGHA